MTFSMDQSVWPIESLGDALLTLAKFSRLPHQPVRLTLPVHLAVGRVSRPVRLDSDGPGNPSYDATLNDAPRSKWLEAAAERISLEAEPVAAPYAEIESLLRRASPAIIAIRCSPHESHEPMTKYLVVIGATKRQLKVVGPDLSTHMIAIAEVEESLCRSTVFPHIAPVEALLTEIGLTGRQRASAKTALLEKRLADEQIGGCWLLRAPGRSEIQWSRWLSLLIGAHVVEQACVLAAWSLLGWMTFSGRLDTGWLLAWIVLLGCVVPFRLLSTSAGGRLSLEFSSSLRRRLLAGALRLDPDRVRVEGTGGLLGRTLEVDALEQLALGGGTQGALSIVELLMAAGVLGSAASQWGGVALLATFVALAVLLSVRSVRRRDAWTDSRLSLTNDLVERMVGHRTTLAQERRERAAADVDQSLEGYVAPSTNLDRSSVWLQAFVPRAWLLCGLMWLGPGFVSGSQSVTTLAVSLGGLLLARQGLQRLVEGLDRLAGAAIAWRRLQPFLSKPDQPEPVGDPDFAWTSETQRMPVCGGAKEVIAGSLSSSSGDSEGSENAIGLAPLPHGRGSDLHGGDLLVARDVTFRHSNRSEPLLRGLDVTIRTGDRLLLEGPSGGGKSTLAALLSGGRTAQAGVLLLRGLDRQTLGMAWRQRVVLAPQFHHNHVLLGTFLFNLLLGRNWPPSKADVADADRLCRALDLGPLIDRMPGGLMQMVGETGWQLSHGERSRLFLARVLLQGAEVVVLDETFAALDPETLSRTLPCVLAQAPALLVIAHP